MDIDFKRIGQLFARSAGSGSGKVVGIDFGSSSIKVVELSQEEESVMLSTYGELQLGPFAQVPVGRATNLEPGRITEALRDIIREAQVTSTTAGVAVPYAASFVTVISVPAQDQAALAGLVPLEARKYVPVPVNQVTLDWFPLPEKKGAEKEVAAPTTMRVLLAAIHNEALSKYKVVAEGASLATAFNEIEIFSTIRSSVQNAQDTVMVIDIGAATAKLYIVSGGIVQATHSVTVGGQDLTLALSKSLELDPLEAEEMKRQVGLTATDNPRIERAMSLPLERIFTDARRLIEMYERGNGVEQISSVILSGGGSALKGLEAYAQGVLSRRIVRADPFSKVVYPAFLEGTLKEIGPSFSVALGVALRALAE